MIAGCTQHKHSTGQHWQRVMCANGISPFKATTGHGKSLELEVDLRMAISERWLAIFLYKGRSLVLYSKSLAADHIHWRNSQRRLYKPSKAMHSGGWIYTEGMQDGLPNTS